MRTLLSPSSWSQGRFTGVAVLAGARGLILAFTMLLAIGGWATGNAAIAQCVGAWVPGIGTPGTNGEIWALAVLPSGDVVAGGAFTTAGGASASRIARVNPTTGAFSRMGAGAGVPDNGVNDIVYALALVPNGDLITGGAFGATANVVASGIARYNLTTGSWSAFARGFSTRVTAVAILPGGDVIAGGFFTTAQGLTTPLNHIARYDAATTNWLPLGTGTTGDISALAVLPGGDLIVGGGFTTAGGVVANSIARVNPTTGVWSALGAGVFGIVNALAVLPGGDVILGGNFTTAGGMAANSIARVNPTTGVWSRLGSGTNNQVNALAALPGGDVIVGGYFTSAGGVAGTNYIARVNPTSGEWSALGVGTNNFVYALAVLPGGDVIVGGGFTTAGGVAANCIARYFPGAPAPRILSQPLPLAVGPSSNAVFYVGATAGFGSIGTPMYQWRKGGVAINTITNASAATPGLSLTNVQATDIGSYTCLVTNSCGGTGTLSNAATLTFVAPPVSPACSLADIAGSLNGDVPVPDGIVDGNDFIAFINAFGAGC